MINFVRLVYNNFICSLVMKNNRGQQVEIPIPREVAQVISAHLAKISDAAPIMVERGEENQYSDGYDEKNGGTF